MNRKQTEEKMQYEKKRQFNNMATTHIVSTPPIKPGVHKKTDADTELNATIMGPDVAKFNACRKSQGDSVAGAAVEKRTSDSTRDTDRGCQKKIQALTVPFLIAGTMSRRLSMQVAGAGLCGASKSLICWCKNVPTT